MINAALHNNWQNVENLGVNPTALIQLLDYSTGVNPITRGIHLSKHDKGKVFAFVKRFDVGDERHAQITVGTHRHGGETFTFNSFKESRADKPAWIAPAKITPVAPPKQDDNEWRITRFNQATTAFNAATGASVSNHPYILKKGVDTTGIDIRLCDDKLQYPFYDINGTLKGYQTIDAAGVKRPVIAKSGDTAGAFCVVGNREMVQFGFIPAEGLATGLSVYRSEKLNPNKLPVVVCLSAGNLRKVVALFIEKYGKDCVNLYPDNDCGLSDNGEFTGNTGVYDALEICHEYGIKSYRLPQMDGLKCDFNDTESFIDVEVPTGIDYQRAIIAVAPLQLINKLIWQYAYQVTRETRIDAKTSDETADYLTIAEAIALIVDVAKPRGIDVEMAAAKFVHKKIVEQVTQRFAYQVPSKLSIKQAAGATIAELEKYGMTGNRADIEIQIENDVKRRRELCRNLNKITDFTDTMRHNVDGYDMTRIIERLECENLRSKNIFCDIRGMGKGKTQFMAARIKDMRYAVYITHRTALVADACKTLGLESYKGGDIYADKIGICINSLLKFALAVRGMPLFIDEARQVYDTLINSPTIENRRALIDCFIGILEAAPSIHLADAGMNDEALAFYRRHCGGKKIHIIETTVTDSTVNHWLLPDLDACRFSILKKLGQGGRGLVGCTSEKEAKKTRLFLIKNGINPKRILLCYSKNKGDKKVAAFLADVNAEGVKYDVIIHTSVLGSGVSVVIPEFTFTYLLCSNVIASNESLQMMARNRCATDVFLAFGAQLDSGRVANIETLKKGAIDKVKNFAADNGMDVSEVLNELGTAQVLATANLNADLNDFANNLLLLAEIEGRNFVRVSKIEGEKTAGLGAEVDAQTVIDIEAAVIVDAKEFKRIENSNNPTQAESDSVDRYRAVDMTGLAPTAIVTADFENYVDGKMTVLTNYELIDADTEILKTADIANFQTRNRQKSLVSRQKVIKAALLPLQTAMDNQGSFTQAETLAVCMVLKKYHAELAGEFGNYNKKTFIRPTKTAGYFIEKFGFKIVEIGKKTDGNRERIYRLKIDDDILRYAANRKGCS
jgi:hypothetical protein